MTTDLDLDFDLPSPMPNESEPGDVAPAATVTTAETPVATVSPNGRRGRPRKSVATREPLYVDIETVPDESRMDVFGLEPLPVMPPTTPQEELLPAEEFLSQDLEAIRTWLESRNPPLPWLMGVSLQEKSAKNRKGLHDAIEAHQDRLEKIAAAEEDRRKLLSVTPEFCRIVALGWACGNDVVESLTCGPDTLNYQTTDERLLLEKFWALAAAATPIVGYGCLHFDLPTLFVRSALLGVKPTRRFDLRPWGEDVADLCEKRFARQKAMGLKRLCGALGIPVECPDVDGSHVYQLWRENPDKLGEYVRSDVMATRALATHWRGYFL